MVVMLPRDFIGSPRLVGASARILRYMKEGYNKTVMMFNLHRNPDLFITYTGNPKWPEIVEWCSKNNSTWADNFDIGVRVGETVLVIIHMIPQVFEMKMAILERRIFKEMIFGKVGCTNCTTAGAMLVVHH